MVGSGADLGGVGGEETPDDSYDFSAMKATFESDNPEDLSEWFPRAAAGRGG